jgi:DNA processing protein
MTTAPRDRLATWCAVLDAGLSSAVVHRALAAMGSPEGLLGADDDTLASRAGLRRDQITRLRESQRDDARRARQLEVFDEHGMTLLEPGEPGWPEGFASLVHPPPVLFLRGTLRAEDRLALAVVGPRMATPYGLEMAKRFARELAPVLTIVSGGAHGIDSTAHRACLEAGGRTLGVAACSLDQDYPKGNGPLRGEIAGSGALVSIYPPLTKAATHRFPERNVLMAALSLAVLVVEASSTSGALITASAGGELGRDVFAIPGDVTRRNSEGTNGLLRDGAIPATRPSEILAELEVRLDHELIRLRADRVRNAPAPPPPAARPAEGPQALLLDLLEHHERTYDQLLEALVPGALSRGAFATALLQLEIKGLVRQLPGKVYVARVT